MGSAGKAAASRRTPKKGTKGTRTSQRHKTEEKGGRGLGEFFFGGEAIVADAADFGAGDGDVEVTVAGDLLHELLVESGLEFADLAAADAGNMDMIAGAVGFVVVAVAAEMEEIEFVDETFFFEELDRTVDGDEMDFRTDLLGAIEDLIDVEVLLGGIHDLQNNAALAREADAALAKSGLQMA